MARRRGATGCAFVRKPSRQADQPGLAVPPNVVAVALVVSAAALSVADGAVEGVRVEQPGSTGPPTERSASSQKFEIWHAKYALRAGIEDTVNQARSGAHARGWWPGCLPV